MLKVRSNKRFRVAIIALGVVVIAAGIVTALHINSVHSAQKKSGTIPTSKKSSSSTSNKKATTQKGNQSAATDNNPGSSNPKLPGSAVSTSAVLAMPFGTFISNHRPGQNGSPTSEQSTCNTTPGATCDIQFTSGGVTKSLGAQITDSNGTAYWSWDINGGTLAPGTWQITAVAKLNGQTKTATDPTPLEVQ